MKTFDDGEEMARQLVEYRISKKMKELGKGLSDTKVQDVLRAAAINEIKIENNKSRGKN